MGRYGLRLASPDAARLAAGLVLSLAIWSVGAPAHAEQTTYEYQYVVPPAQSDGVLDLPSPAPDVAYHGEVQVTPIGDSVTVTIDDVVHPEGGFLFRICQPNQPGPLDSDCGLGHDDVSTGNICYRGTETLQGVVPGNPVEVVIWWATSPCPNAPVTGTLTVRA